LSGGEDLPLTHLDRPGREGLAQARTRHAHPVFRSEQGPVSAAEDVRAVAGQEAVAGKGQGPAGVRATIHIAGQPVAHADHEAHELRLALAEAEAEGAGIGHILDRAKP